MLIEEYDKYLEDNITDLAKYVDAEVNVDIDNIKNYVIDFIKDTFSGCPPFHYYWEYDGCPYDYSGEIYQDGFIRKDQTLSDFFENEYTGERIASYCSGHGWSYETYGKVLQQEVEHLFYLCVCRAVRKFINDSFDTNINDDDFEDLRMNSNSFCDVECYSESYEWVCECDGILAKFDISDKSIQSILDDC